VAEVTKDLAAVFPLTRVFWCPIPSYPGSLFTFTVGSRGPDPSAPLERVTWPTRWYTPAIHRAAFSLPPFLADLLPKKVSAPTSGNRGR
jgi:spermidine synthase